TARFSKWAPSDRYTNLERSVVEAKSSFSKYTSDHRGAPFTLKKSVSLYRYLEFASHQPNRTSNIVMRKASGGDVWNPMFGLAAAPEIENAVPRRTPPISGCEGSSLSMA